MKSKEKMSLWVFIAYFLSLVISLAWLITKLGSSDWYEPAIVAIAISIIFMTHHTYLNRFYRDRNEENENDLRIDLTSNSVQHNEFMSEEYMLELVASIKQESSPNDEIIISAKKNDNNHVIIYQNH